jgi:hypothetical protein
MSLPSPADFTGLPLDPDMLRRIESYARSVGSTPAEVVREAFEEYVAVHDEARSSVARDETAFDILHRAGLIGCVKGDPDSPTDLGTNPAHMEGFGRE